MYSNVLVVVIEAVDPVQKSRFARRARCHGVFVCVCLPFFLCSETVENFVLNSLFLTFCLLFVIAEIFEHLTDIVFCVCMCRKVWVSVWSRRILNVRYTEVMNMPSMGGFAMSGCCSEVVRGSCARTCVLRAGICDVGTLSQTLSGALPLNPSGGHCPPHPRYRFTRTLPFTKRPRHVKRR